MASPGSQHIPALYIYIYIIFNSSSSCRCCIPGTGSCQRHVVGPPRSVHWKHEKPRLWFVSTWRSSIGSAAKIRNGDRWLVSLVTSLGLRVATFMDPIWEMIIAASAMELFILGLGPCPSSKQELRSLGYVVDFFRMDCCRVVQWCPPMSEVMTCCRVTARQMDANGRFCRCN